MDKHSRRLLCLVYTTQTTRQSVTKMCQRQIRRGVPRLGRLVLFDKTIELVYIIVTAHYRSQIFLLILFSLYNSGQKIKTNLAHCLEIFRLFGNPVFCSCIPEHYFLLNI